MILVGSEICIRDSFLFVLYTISSAAKEPSQLINEIKPQFIFYLSGVDVINTDKLGRLSLSIEGCKKRDQIIFSICKNKEIPVQCSMGGGYSKDIKIIIEAHANTYRIAQKIY